MLCFEWIETCDKLLKSGQISIKSSLHLCVLLFFPVVMKRFAVLILKSISPRGICCVFLFYENWNFVSKCWSQNVAPSSKKRGQNEILSSVDVVSLLQLYFISPPPHHFCSFNHIRFAKGASFGGLGMFQCFLLQHFAWQVTLFQGHDITSHLEFTYSGCVSQQHVGTIVFCLLFIPLLFSVQIIYVNWSLSICLEEEKLESCFVDRC